MKKTAAVTCDDCYFRRLGVCALTNGPCPTFRPFNGGVLVPPRQPQLVPRPEQAPAPAAA